MRAMFRIYGNESHDQPGPQLVEKLALPLPTTTTRGTRTRKSRSKD